MLKVDWYEEVRGAIKDPLSKPQSGQRTKGGRHASSTPGRACRLVDPHDAAKDLDLRARSYLHANCSSCHVEAGGGNARIDSISSRRGARSSTRSRCINRSTWPRLVAPGHPERSVLAHRVGLTAPGRMPPLATNLVDERGVALRATGFAG